MWTKNEFLILNQRLCQKKLFSDLRHHKNCKKASDFHETAQKSCFRSFISLRASVYASRNIQTTALSNYRHGNSVSGGLFMSLKRFQLIVQDSKPKSSINLFCSTISFLNCRHSSAFVILKRRRQKMSKNVKAWREPLSPRDQLRSQPTSEGNAFDAARRRN